MEKKPVSIGWQVVFVIIPYVWIYAFYRIEKLRIGIVLAIITTIVGIGFQMILPFPWGLAFALFGNAWLVVFFHRRWTKQWNSKFE